MAVTQRHRMQALLSSDPSPLRAELLRMGFEALAQQPLSVVLGDPGIAPLVLQAMTRDNTRRVAERYLLKALDRMKTHFDSVEDRVRDTLPKEAEEQLARVLAAGEWPRFAWMKGAIDTADLAQLFAPVVQQVLIQYTTKLPIPGVGASSGSGAGGGALGGLVGMIGKQVSKSAGQLADVGKSVIGGLGPEFERRMQTLARDFSQTAMTEFRSAVEARIRSEEGKELIRRMRDRALEHVLESKLSVVVADLMHLPFDRVTRMSESIVEHNRDHALFRTLLEAELEAALNELGSHSLLSVLTQAGLADPARKLCMAAVEPGLKKLVASDEFGAFLDQLLAQSAVP